jgi:superfamily I DNA/RNA helicase/mRNA-degrading endonuclease RelE of RelBE toxin-antitoxin system
MSLAYSPRVAIASQFFDAFARLPKEIQRKVSNLMAKFQQNPAQPSLNYESIHNAGDKNMKSLRVDGKYRAIVLKPEQGTVYLLLWVDNHDQAYEWACRRTCLINQVSGAIQIIDVREVEATTQKLSQQQGSQPDLSYRFADITDSELMALGVPEILLPAVRQVISDEDVEAILAHLPPEASDALLLLAAGYPLSEVKQQLDKPKVPTNVDPTDFVTALERDETLGQFMLVTEDDALMEMLAAPLEKWRVFLHPSQRKLINRDWQGPVRILGGAGTGKTVVAIHRAKWLAQSRFNQPGDRILFTTFTRNLAEDIKLNLQSICSSDLMERIEVINLDQWVHKFLRQEGFETTIVYEETLEPFWQEAYTLAPADLGLPLGFYQDEWKQVVLKYGCESLRDYLQARRLGRGKQLSRVQKQQIWPVFEEYRNLLREKGYWEADEAMASAAQYIENEGFDLLPYRAVIVDEAQDMSDSAFKLLRAIAGPEHENDLFIVGDAHQRIYGKFVTLSQCGIHIVGRSRKLRLNYRTTDEIRQWSTAILKNTTVDDLNGGEDTLRDYYSLLHGDPPVVKGFPSAQAEVDYLQQYLNHLQQQGQALSSVCFVFRTQQVLEDYQSKLQALGIPCQVIKRDEPDTQRNPDLLKFATMHRVKGLQFDYIFLPGLNHDILPLQSGLQKSFNEQTRNIFTQGEKCLLHVAATRAKKQVLVSYWGEPSSLLPINPLS